tara:strand:- start:1047 stop:2222 length:1176 start_codon:yes stop_codon:yes gene_type:complete
MPTYFVGNVLPPSSDPGEDDPTFDFTTDESKNMNLRNVPIRLEHEEGLAVGSVQRDWTDSDGKKWILGKVESNSLESRFAEHAIKPSSFGHTLYKGLSLQHVHTSFSNGETSKRAIEVSLCADPRRPGCNVTCVNETKKKEYITHLASNQNMSSEPTSAPIENTTPVETTPVSVAAPVAETETANPANQEELMKLVIDQENELSGTKTALEKAHAELMKLQSAWTEREDNEKLQTKSKAEALSKALVDSWSASLPADMMTDENKQAIFALAQNFPQESVKMMEIAHKASKKYKSDMDNVVAQQQDKQKRQLESRVMDIVTKKRRFAPETTSVVHAASVKKANPFNFGASNNSSSMNSVRERNPQLFSALSGYSTGNLRDRMGQIAQINGNN